KVHFASDQLTNEPFIVPSTEMNEENKQEEESQDENEEKMNDDVEELNENANKAIKINVKNEEILNVESEMLETDAKTHNEEESVIKIENNAITTISRISVITLWIFFLQNEKLNP
ncbi:hypothetical protein BpHYR1_002862, partial [Brachionus plicatilis]